MLTITQFSGNLLKTARGLLPRQPKAAPPPAAEAAPAAAEAAPPAEGNAEAAADAAPAAEAAPAPAAEAAPADDSAAREILSKHFGFDEARTGHLLAALRVAGNKLDSLRQVRVVRAEGAPESAPRDGDAAFILDMVEAPKKDRGPRKPKFGGAMGGKPGATGKKNLADPLSGGFTFDAMKEDRKREGLDRGGPGGRGRGGPGGGRGRGGPGGGGPGGAGRPGGGGRPAGGGRPGGAHRTQP